MTARVKFTTVSEPWWDDRPVYIIGGGPSLRGRDLSRLRERGYVLAVNRAFEFTPVTAVFSIDYTFMENYADKLKQISPFREVYLAVHDDYIHAPVPGARYIQRINGQGLSRDPAAVINGLNSGYSAINLAILKRAKVIYLMGFDLLPTPETKDTHWHGGYPWSRGLTVKYYGRWAEMFDHIQAQLPGNVTVFNCNPKSAIRCFPFRTYEQVGAPHAAHAAHASAYASGTHASNQG